MLDVLAGEFARPMSQPFGVVVLRLCMAVLLGGALGWERELRNRAAGLRTHMLISLAAACFTLVALNLVDFTNATEAEQRIDPLRLIEAVTAGVAFLAAGSIIISHGSVRGLTTGASMWLCGAIGLCCGTGDLRLALLVTALALIVLSLVRAMFEKAARDEKEEEN
ncbi:MgtC/SapB family protein [Paracoccus sp. MBLB3053]|uniref:Protein MgtC n=1 Tax=Paracoccus aurantius TaxID=3073814 RepID=A0ABU2HRB6_9RHOB|nr:MgtC/SapB family protein [Paracoccus sp. MBLB3053]MDS9467591.1 MgtC/SapB family protein [Paracoccus sp. MBLB3053]